MTKCSVCNARGARPCVDSYGHQIDQYHQQRVVDSLQPKNHAAEGARLRAAMKGIR